MSRATRWMLDIQRRAEYVEEGMTVCGDGSTFYYQTARHLRRHMTLHDMTTAHVFVTLYACV